MSRRAGNLREPCGLRRFGLGNRKFASEQANSSPSASLRASRDIEVHENVLRKWVKEFTSDPNQAFPGHGQMKPEQLEIDRLRREVTKLKAERDILRKAAAYFVLRKQRNRSRRSGERYTGGGNGAELSGFAGLEEQRLVGAV
jgi:transposase